MTLTSTDGVMTTCPIPLSARILASSNPFAVRVRCSPLEAAEFRRLLALRCATESQDGASEGAVVTGDCAPLGIVGEVVPEVQVETELWKGAEAILRFSLIKSFSFALFVGCRLPLVDLRRGSADVLDGMRAGREEGPASSSGWPCVLCRRPVALREREEKDRIICARSFVETERELEMVRLLRGESPSIEASCNVREEEASGSDSGLNGNPRP